jgi:hypothetical protein
MCYERSSVIMLSVIVTNVKAPFSIEKSDMKETPIWIFLSLIAKSVCRVQGPLSKGDTVQSVSAPLQFANKENCRVEEQGSWIGEDKEVNSILPFPSVGIPYWRSFPIIETSGPVQQNFSP